MDKFLETHNILRLDNEEIENPNRLIKSRETGSVIKKVSRYKSLGTDGFPA